MTGPHVHATITIVTIPSRPGYEAAVGRAVNQVIPWSTAMTADRHMLFGLLALQNGIINQGQLVAAFQAWTLDKSKSLAEYLEARGDLRGPTRAHLEGLADFHLEAQGGDVEKSLAAVAAGKAARVSLAQIGDPKIGTTLGRGDIPDGSTQDDDPDA